MIVFLKHLYFQLNLTLPGQTMANDYHPLLFSILTHFLSLFLPLYSSIALHSKSKSCVTIATAAVCENYLNPSLFFHCVFPVTFNGYCFDVGTHNQVEGVKKKRSGRETDVKGTTEQSSRAEWREEGLKAWWPDSQPERNREKKTETESKHGQGCTQENRQSCRYIKHKTNKQTNEE